MSHGCALGDFEGGSLLVEHPTGSVQRELVSASGGTHLTQQRWTLWLRAAVCHKSGALQDEHAVAIDTKNNQLMFDGNIAIVCVC